MNVADEIRIIKQQLSDIGRRLGKVCSGIGAHHTQHEQGGSDSIKLDNLTTPDDNIDLDASIAEHGLLKKLDNDGTHYMDGQGGWTVPAGGGGGGVEFSWESVRCPDRYYSSNAIDDALGAMKTSVNDKGYAMPFLVPCQQSFDRLGILVQVAGSAISKIRLGIYEDDGQCYPGSLVVASGELATNTNGFKEANIDELLDAGLYWLVCNTNAGGTGAANFKALNQTKIMSPLGWPLPLVTTGYEEHFYYKDPMAYGALPDPFPAGATMINVASMIAIFLRKKNAIP